ncbi:MAG TPA: hypothetical protein VGN72_09995 [Tepidisphaeraceae bacterium]|jgi:hypothetical protein|nr:hypothetical protein [Tepidisphaeraceae bacterium]
MSDLLTPKKFAAEMGKGLGFVMSLINNGEIEVEDHRSPGKTLPRYMINREQIAIWRNNRRTRKNPKTEQQQGRQQPQELESVIR